MQFLILYHTYLNFSREKAKSILYKYGFARYGGSEMNEEMQIKYCKNCGRPVPIDAVFCCYCGSKGQFSEELPKRKRDNGSGTVMFDPRCRKGFVARGPAPRRQYLGTYPTFDDAEEAIDNFIRLGCPELYNATLEVVYNLWSETHYKRINKKTADCYRSSWKHFKPISDMKMKDIKTVHFQQLVDEHVGAGVSSNIKTLAKALCHFAMENDIINKNYAEFVKLPKIEKVEKMIFTTQQITKLWRHSHDCNVQAILVMIYMGFRIGEITSITTDSVNLREGYIVGGIKTEAGKARIVPFPKNIPEIQGFVASWLRRAIPGERLFPMTEHTFRNKIFYGTLIELGMVDAHVDDKGAPVFHTDRHLTPHSTRHTFASLSVAAGMRPERLQHIIGHASFKTTADYYVHVDHGALISEMGKLLRDCS